MRAADIGSLLTQCAGNMDALEQLYRLLKKDVFAFAYSLLGDAASAEDCVQETFVRLPGAAGRLRDPRKGKTFIFSVARYVALEMKRRQGPAAGEEAAETLPDGESDFTGSVEAALLLNTLEEDARQILVLHVYNGWTFREIAAFLERPVSTVKSIYTRACARMKREWRSAYDVV